MKAYRIKILQSALDTYWYAGLEGTEYWATLEEREDSHMQYAIIPEGKIPLSGNGIKWIDYDECEVIRESFIQVDSDEYVAVVEI